MTRKLRGFDLSRLDGVRIAIKSVCAHTLR
jgi:hypothetical protein